jgi:hypothetical protein
VASLVHLPSGRLHDALVIREAVLHGPSHDPQGGRLCVDTRGKNWPGSMNWAWSQTRCGESSTKGTKSSMIAPVRGGMGYLLQ